MTKELTLAEEIAALQQVGNHIALTNDSFWILRIGDGKTFEKYFYFNPFEAYHIIERMVIEGEATTETVALLSVDCSTDNWEIKQVLWQEIFQGAHRPLVEEAEEE